jgi:hypothetical protein
MKTMNEEEFDSVAQRRPFGTADAIGRETQMRRSIALGVALWGKTSKDLQHQLLAPYPEIPAGFDLADFRELQRNVRAISAAQGDPRFAWLPHGAVSCPTIFGATQRLTEWEARCEIVRRAIEYLEKH